MRVLIAPDKFKGCLNADLVAASLSRGWKTVFPKAEIRCLPIADGGDGTVKAFLAMKGSVKKRFQTLDARLRPINAEIAWLPETRTAILETASAAGLAGLSEKERNPMVTSTTGVGILIQKACRLGAKTILVGLGGSATNDGGTGMASALGWNFLDRKGKILNPANPKNLQTAAQISPPSDSLTAQVIGLCDVSVPLLGKKGCSQVFAPQKGADARMVVKLEGVLKQLVKLVQKAEPATKKFHLEKGSGAAGGLGYGIRCFANGLLRPGFETVADAIHLQESVCWADLILTAEGRLDAQTLEGKGPVGVAAMARKAGKPVIAFAGALEAESQLHGRFDACLALANRPLTLEESFLEVEELLVAAARRAARLLQIGKSL